MKIISYFIIIFLTPTLILLNYRFLVFNHNFYKSEFAKLNIYQQFASRQVVDTQSTNLIRYFCCAQTLDEYFYTQKEILHLADVKNLILLTNTLMVFFSILLLITTLFLIIKKQLKALFKTYQLSSLATLVIIFVLYLSSKLNFAFIFINFHYLTFRNDYYLLSENSSLLKLFPQQFFVDFTNQLAFNILISALAILISSSILILIQRKKPLPKSKTK